MPGKEIKLLSTRPLDEAVVEKAAHQNIIIDATPFIKVKKSITSEVQNRIEILSNRNQQ